MPIYRTNEIEYQPDDTAPAMMKSFKGDFMKVGLVRYEEGIAPPPHFHPNEEQFIYVLEGKFDLILDGSEAIATPGDLIRLPRGIPHGIFNKSEETNKCLFWVSPARKLYDLFWGIHNLGPTANPAEVVELSAKHEVDFLPPPEDQ